jgi:hypothetical protein
MVNSDMIYSMLAGLKNKLMNALWIKSNVIKKFSIFSLSLIEMNDFPRIDIDSRTELKKNPDNYWLLLNLVIISLRLERHDCAKQYVKMMYELLDNGVPNLDHHSQETNKRILLIKEWGSGFWADIDHIIGQLLLAEITKRIPIVYWGGNSLYNNSNQDDCFSHFFSPVSHLTLSDIQNNDSSYYPKCWNPKNILQSDPKKYLKEHSSEAGILFFVRKEDIVVSDRHINLATILPWVPKNHPVFNFDENNAFYYMYNKYISLNPSIQNEIKIFFDAKMTNKHLIAVHVRGGDRTESFEKLSQNNLIYFKAIDDYLTVNPESFIFICTDSTYVLTEFHQKYQKNLIYTDSHRSMDKTGIHYNLSLDKERIAIETIIDVYLALKCDYFIGCESNVSVTIKKLKNWGSKCIILPYIPSRRL